MAIHSIGEAAATPYLSFPLSPNATAMSPCVSAANILFRLVPVCMSITHGDHRKLDKAWKACQVTLKLVEPCPTRATINIIPPLVPVHEQVCFVGRCECMHLAEDVWYICCLLSTPIHLLLSTSTHTFLNYYTNLSYKIQQPTFTLQVYYEYGVLPAFSSPP
jgi:hypothetical protein